MKRSLGGAFVFGCNVLLAAACGDSDSAVSMGAGGTGGAVSAGGGSTDCPAGETRCGTECVSLSTNVSHCGMCNAACGVGQSCENGQCTCPPGLMSCSGICIDVSQDVSNCGGCGAQCPLGGLCQQGVCSCPPGRTDCSGVCVDLMGDGANCGACGAACAAGLVCSAGSCEASCTVAGQTACGQSCVDLQTDPFNCGACGAACASGQTCTAGTCSCASGLTLCSGTCVDTSQDPNHCGACGTACTGGQACQSGVCACPAGQQLCGAACTDTSLDAANCGSCGNACAAAETCQNGTCIGATGGAGGTGGEAAGGTATGGAGTGADATGGASTGGAATGGAATGGVSTGGAATGGVSTGGAATGGESTGCTDGDYYVAPNGNDSNPGTMDQPFATFNKAQSSASAGDTVYFREGTWSFSSGTVGFNFTKSGSAGALIKYFACPGEVPVVDLSAINPSGRVTGLNVAVNYVHIRGFEVTGVPQYQSGQDSWAVRIQGSNNILERLDVHHNEAPGIFITTGGDNLVLDCDSHHNYDVLESGGSADGFGCHSTNGGNNVFRGCRAWYNSDDGVDFINASGGTCIIESSWAFLNGFIPDTNTAVGNGAGFKAGGYTNSFTTAYRHQVRFCVAFGNRRQGFYANHHDGGLDFINNTAYNNEQYNYSFLTDLSSADHYVRNNISVGTRHVTDVPASGADIAFNSWDLSVTASADDFVSVDTSLATSPRQADGSLPDTDLFRLAAGSDLVDQGQDVGYDYNGSAPDLGAFEQ